MEQKMMQMDQFYNSFEWTWVALRGKLYQRDFSMLKLGSSIGVCLQ